MIKKTLYFGNPAKLKLQLTQLVIESAEPGSVSRSVPVEDIGLVIIDHSQITITHGAINAMIGNNAAILFCDAHHLPNGLVLPYTTNHTFSEKTRFQLEASEPLKKQLWKQTVQAKIGNQIAVLKAMGKPVDNMKYWQSNVSSGDAENHEGRAAAYYWKTVFTDYDINPQAEADAAPAMVAEPLPPHFLRQRYGDPPNNLLNYGYAVLRAIVARSLVASGCLPVLGIHHRNKYNHFCLADDIMEPYRPYVDRLVLHILAGAGMNFDGELTGDIKKVLLTIPVIDVNIDGSSSPLMVAMQRTTSSLMRCYEGEGRKILYPVIE
ncbi:MAG: type II CRISPR-associated endonuclease Cas1 [Bacteroidota bacterium]